jgi:hypothetical protein
MTVLGEIKTDQSTHKGMSHNQSQIAFHLPKTLQVLPAMKVSQPPPTFLPLPQVLLLPLGVTKQIHKMGKPSTQVLWARRKQKQ